MNTKSQPAEPTAALIAGLETGATLVDTGRFSVDWPRAVQMMGSRALGDPAEWLALVVQSGVLLGAGMVDIRFGKKECEVDFKEVAMSLSELSDLWSMLDQESDTPRRSALYKLALAFATLLTHGAERLEVEVPGHLAVYSEAAHTTHETTMQECRTRLRVVFGNAADAIRSTKVTSSIRTRAILSETNIAFDGESVTTGWHAILNHHIPRVKIHDSEGKLIGMGGYPIGRAEPSMLLVLVGGLRVEEVELPNCNAGFIAVVDCDLPLDLSQRHVVRGKRFEDVVQRVVDAHVKVARPSPEHKAQRAVDLAGKDRRRVVRTSTREEGTLWAVVVPAVFLLVILILLAFISD